MNLAGLVAGYGNIAEGERKYANTEMDASRAEADSQTRLAHNAQVNMDNAMKLRKMREMDAARIAQNAAADRDVGTGYTPLARGASWENLAAAAAAPPAATPGLAIDQASWGPKNTSPWAGRTAQMANQSDAESSRLSRAVGQPAEDPGLAALIRIRAARLRGTQASVADQEAYSAYLDRTRKTQLTRATPATPEIVEASPQDAAARLQELRAKNYNPNPPAIARPPVYTPAAAPAGGGQAPLADRNNNPGNLKFAGQSGATPGPMLPDGTRFAIFQTPEAGATAAQNQLQLEMSRGNNTVAGIINKWSPAAADGNTPASTQNYIATVAAALGVQPNQPLTPAQIPQMAQAMFRVERGSAPAAATTAGGSAPAGAPAPQTPTVVTSLVTGEQIELSPQSAGLAQQRMDRIRQERAMYVEYMKAAYSPEEKIKLRQAILGMDLGMAEADLTQMASAAAYGDRGSLTGLAQALSNQTGTKIGVTPTAGGDVVITTNGKTSAPLTMGAAASKFHLALSQELQAQKTKQDAAISETYLKALVDEQVKQPGRVEIEQMKLGGKEREELIKTMGSLTLEKAKSAELRDQYTTHIDAMKGTVYLVPKSGARVLMYMPGGKDSFGNMTDAELVEAKLPTGTVPVKG